LLRVGAIVVLYVILITKCISVAKSAKDDMGSYIAIGAVRNTCFSYSRKYRDDNRVIANNRCTSAVYKLWGQFTIN